MKKYTQPLVLAVLVLIVYANTWQNSFQYDDIHSILEKPWIRGLDKIPSFIFSFTQRPLLILTFNLNFAISEFEVWSYHLFNIFLHLGVVLLVYRFTRLARDNCLRGDGASPAYRPLPFLTALFFALHPLHTQSVTYIASRSAVMVTLFYLGTLICFVRGLEQRRATAESEAAAGGAGLWYFAGAAVCLAAGALTKEIIITVPAMAFLFHYYFLSSLPFRRWLGTQWKWIAGAGVILAAGVLFKLLAHGKILISSAAEYSSASYFLTQTFVIPFEYLWEMTFPFNLSIDVGFPMVEDWTAPSSYLGMLVLALYTGFVVRISRTRPYVGFGLAWAVITVLPTSSFVPLLDVAVEHRTYLPLVGFSMSAAALFCLLADRVRGAGTVCGLKPRTLHSMMWAGALLTLFCLALGTMNRNRVWLDEVRLWTDAKEKAPRLIRAYNNLGEAYDKLKQYDKAIAEFETTLKMNPRYFFGLNNIGNIYGKKEEFFKAIEYFKKAIAVKPDYGPAHYNLGTAYYKVKQPRKAVEEYRLALKFDPYFEQAYLTLAHTSMDLNHLDEAVANYKKYLDMRPKNTRALFGLGTAYFRMGKLDLALAEFKKAVALDPEYIFPYINIANILLNQGKIDEAIATYGVILSKRPNIAGIHKNLGMIYTQYKRDAAKARLHFQESLRLAPNQPQAAIIRGILAQLSAAK